MSVVGSGREFFFFLGTWTPLNYFNLYLIPVNFYVNELRVGKWLFFHTLNKLYPPSGM